jgi:signal transduction histidine kinase
MNSRLSRACQHLSLTQRVMLASLVILVAGMYGVGRWVGQQIEAGVVHRTAATTALYVDSFVAPLLQELAERDGLNDEHVAALDNLLRNTPLGEDIASFKVWDAGGRIVYSSDPALVGAVFPMQGGLEQAWHGEVAARVSALEDEENDRERQSESRLLEMYSPVRLRGTDQIIAVAEFYQRVEDLEGDIATSQRSSWLVFGAGTLVMYLLLAGFVRQTSNTIDRQRAALSQQVARLTELLGQNEALHERVQRAAGRTVALNERFLRRISAELHDGPAQDLGLALLRLDQALVTCTGCEEASSLDGASTATADIREALNRAMREVRAISAGLGLPPVGELSVPETLARAVRAYEARTGTRVSQQVGHVPEQAPLPVKIAIYRVVQEALNNAYRHAGGAGQELRVRGADGFLIVEVTDKGPGFDGERALRQEGHLGLVGMRERVESLGGRFFIESGPGRGTRVSAHFPLEVADEQRN